VDLTVFTRRSEYEWEIPQQGAMRVPGVIYASEALMREMDQKVYEQTVDDIDVFAVIEAVNGEACDAS